MGFELQQLHSVNKVFFEHDSLLQNLHFDSQPLDMIDHAQVRKVFPESTTLNTRQFLKVNSFYPSKLYVQLSLRNLLWYYPQPIVLYRPDPNNSWPMYSGKYLK